MGSKNLKPFVCGENIILGVLCRVLVVSLAGNYGTLASRTWSFCWAAFGEEELSDPEEVLRVLQRVITRPSDANP